MDYRRSILADPEHPTEAMTAHAALCHDCTGYTERLLRFESRIGHALRVEVAEGESAAAVRPTVIPLRAGRPQAGFRRRVRRRWAAIAASAVVAAVVAGSLWVAAPRDSLAADVVSHMAGEPDAWARTDVPVPEPKLDQVLDASHVQLRPSAGLVTYASSCMFRGHRVPHLVVQTQAGPVTVMVLTHETLRSSEQFNEQGYRGVIVPVPGHGSLAVLERGPSMGMQAVRGVAARVLGAIDWTG